MKLIRFSLIFLFMNVLASYGQINLCHRTTEGNDFWFGFMENRTYTNGHFTDITLTSTHTCKFNIYIGLSKTPYATGTLTPNNPIRVPLDWKLVEAADSENKETKGVHLVSDSLLNLYALNWAINSSDVAVIFPIESLGQEYYAMCYTPNINGNGKDTGSGRNSEFLIVGTEDQTTVNITPSKVTDHGRPAHEPFTVTLSKGEVYQVQSENLPIPKFPGQGDLTGSYITSDKPIAFYSGSLATTVPNGPDIRAWDHLYEQIPPLRSWGRKFITVPLKTRHEDTFRVLASEDNTRIQIGNKPSAVPLNKGEFYEFMLKFDEPSLIDSNKPILLAQYSNSVSVDSVYTGGDGDPFMIIVSPVNQTREKVAFVAYESQEINKYFVNVIVKNDAANNIKLDNNILSFTQIGTTGYSYVQANIASGNHLLETIEPGKGFTAYVYGFGGYESYGYGVGFNLDIVLDLGSDINANGNKIFVRCFDKDPLVLDAGNSFDNYLWSTGETSSKIKVSENGWYKVQASTNDGCSLKDSVQIKVDQPVIDLGADQAICKPATAVLDASPDFIHYLWSTKDTTSQITASQTGVYTINATNKYGCSAKDTIALNFVDIPKMDLSQIDTLICGSKTALLDVKKDKGIWTFERLSDGYLFNDPLIAVPDFGNYLFKISAKDQFTCHSDSVIRFNFHPTPTVDFSVDSLKCYGYNLNVNYLGNAGKWDTNFIWMFGNEIIKQGIGVDTCIVPLGINKISRNLKLTVSENGCSNSKTLSGIKVIPNLRMWTNDRQGCAPFTANFNAANTETVNYDWDFGDGNILSGMSLENVANTYQLSGYYNLKLKVSTITGCSNQVEADSLVFIAPTPTVGFTPLLTGCLEKGDQEIFYQGNGDNSARYIWDLSKFDKNEIIKDPLETQGPLVINLKNRPQASIGLKVISKFGCKSDSSSILVKRKPDFTISPSMNAGCAPFTTILTGVVNDKIDLIDFNWKFSDNSTGVGQKIEHTFLNPENQFTITLAGKSLITGCSNEITKTNLISTYPNPKAGFSILNKVIYADSPEASFTNSSTGATRYLWDFGDKTTSTVKDPTHLYEATGYQKVILKALSDNMCSDTISQNILIAFSHLFAPNAFSPNAPNTIDRQFKLFSNGVAPDGYHLRIINRWNDLVFETRDQSEGWNGQMASGAPSPTGLYIWILDFNDFIGRKHRQTGTVILIY